MFECDYHFLNHFHKVFLIRSLFPKYSILRCARLWKTTGFNFEKHNLQPPTLITLLTINDSWLGRMKIRPLVDHIRAFGSFYVLKEDREIL